MHGPECMVCDRGVKPGKLSERGWCAVCESEFVQIMSTISCAEVGGICATPTSCLSARKCTQVKAALEITRNATTKFANTRRVQDVSWERLDLFDDLVKESPTTDTQNSHDKMR